MNAFLEWVRTISVQTRGRWYATVLAVLAVASSYGALDTAEALLVGGVASAVLGNGMAVINAHNWRRWIYGIGLAVQPAAVYLEVATDTQAGLWLVVLSALIGTGTAAATTIPWSPWSHGDEAAQLTRTDNGPRPADGDQS